MDIETMHKIICMIQESGFNAQAANECIIAIRQRMRFRINDIINAVERDRLLALYDLEDF